MNLEAKSLAVAAGLFSFGIVVGIAVDRGPILHAQSSNRVFELRTYTAPDGKLPDLNARFRNHTMRIFKNHGMTNVGYWVPQDAPGKDDTLIYIISHDNREAAKKNWVAFSADPEWKKVAAESQVNGPITSKIVSVFMDATDYSPIK